MSRSEDEVEDGGAAEGAEDVPPRRAAQRMATPARADRVTVEELVRWAGEGRLRIPTFQRPLRWESKDKRDLLDSMERGYPVGTLLLWKRPASSDEVGSPLAGASAKPTSGDVYLVVDGQQRVTTLWEALGRTPEPGAKTMVFELPEERFQYRALTHAEREGREALAKRYPALPLFHALDATALSEWVDPALPREVKRRYFDVGKRLREYPLPIYLVEGDDVDVLREVFDRTNSTGKPLQRDEVFDALVGSRVVRGEAAGLALVNDALRELGFGALERSTIHRAFEAVRGDNVGKSDPRALDLSAVEDDLLRTAAALRRAVSFLQQAAVPHVEALPYELPLVVLARFFALHPEPAERNLVLLRRWLWRGSIAERLGGASGSLQQHVDDVAYGDEDLSVQRLLERTGGHTRPAGERGRAEPFSVATARGKLVLCALLARSPRNLLDGEKLVPSEVLAHGLDGVLRPVVATPVAQQGAPIANRLLHPRCGRNPARLISECRDEGALVSHGITAAMRDSLGAGDIASFLAARSHLLDAWIDEFLESRAEWDRDDALSVLSLASKRAAS